MPIIEAHIKIATHKNNHYESTLQQSGMQIYTSLLSSIIFRTCNIIFAYFACILVYFSILFVY